MRVSRGHGGLSTTLQSCQRVAMGAVSAAIRVSPAECRVNEESPFYNATEGEDS